MKKLCFFRFGGACCLCALLAAVSLPRPGFAQIFDPSFGPPVRILSPPDHAVFYAPVDIPIFAFTRAEVNFTNVEFFANGTALGPAANLASTNRLSYFSYPSPTPLWGARVHTTWCLVWSNAPAGSYALTAVATGLNPLTLIPLARTSAPVNITILSSTNGTNPTNVVSIVATDPIAISGTNVSWIWPGMTNPIPAWTNWPPPKWQSFTNWGPKAAMFTVRRFGDASAPLTVTYDIGGTASNGVDYVELPGSVNIPAGGAYGLIPIMPLDAGSNNFGKTVILKLTPSTNTPPDYRVGFPPGAEAIILYRWPRPLPILLSDGSFHLNSSGPDGAWFAVQNSTDLQNWTSIATNQAFQGSMDYLDANAPNNPQGFYRILPLTNSPPQ